MDDPRLRRMDAMRDEIERLTRERDEALTEVKENARLRAEIERMKCEITRALMAMRTGSDDAAREILESVTNEQKGDQPK